MKNNPAALLTSPPPLLQCSVLILHLNYMPSKHLLLLGIVDTRNGTSTRTNKLL